MAVKIAVIAGIILVLALGLFVYHVATHPGSISLPSFFTVGSSSPFNFSFASISNPTVGIAGIPQTSPGQTQGQTTISGGASTNVINPADIPTGFTLSQLSPYFHEIRFGQVSYGNTSYYGTITLNANQNNTSTYIDITGWQIKTRDSGEYIPQAINLYDPSGLTAPSDIVMKSGDTVSLYSSHGPFNLRLNECIGYIAQIANFNPSLPGNCPQVDETAVNHLTGACQEYIYSLGSCQAPNMASPAIPVNDYTCQDYLENNFNYKSCFDAHLQDANFLSNQIRVWMGANVVDQYHDQVELLDKNGLVVDVDTY